MSGRRFNANLRWAGCLAAALTVFGTDAAFADTCNVRINAMDITVDPDQFSDDSATATRRERALAWPTRKLSRLRGNTPACPSNVTLTFLAQMEGLPDTTGYCLAEGDAASGWLLVPGARNFRGRCSVSTCERVNGTAADLQGLTATVTQFAYGERTSGDTTSVAHSSGAVLMSASRATLQRTLEAGASTALAAAMSTPTALAATALTVTAVGGGVWLCSE
jgi:hypothetical protein